MHNLGVIAAMRGDCYRAITPFDRTTGHEPRSGSAHYNYNRALALLSLGERHIAIE
jgi:hypothetical protein